MKNKKKQVRKPAEQVIDIDAIRQGIVNTWSQIGSDVEAVEGCNNLIAVECCIDADRLTTFGEEEGKAADKLVGEAIEKHGYEKVLRYIAKNIRLY